MLNILTQISRWAIPVMFFGIVFVGLIKKIAVYEALRQWRKEWLLYYRAAGPESPCHACGDSDL